MDRWGTGEHSVGWVRLASSGVRGGAAEFVFCWTHVELFVRGFCPQKSTPTLAGTSVADIVYRSSKIHSRIKIRVGAAGSGQRESSENLRSSQIHCLCCSRSLCCWGSRADASGPRLLLSTSLQSTPNVPPLSPRLSSAVSLPKHHTSVEARLTSPHKYSKQLPHAPLIASPNLAEREGPLFVP